MDALCIVFWFHRCDIMYVNCYFRLLYFCCRDMYLVYFLGSFYYNRVFVRLYRFFTRRKRFMNNASFATRMRKLFRLRATRVSPSCFVIRIGTKRMNGTYKLSQVRLSYSVKRGSKRITSNCTMAAINVAMGSYSTSNRIKRRIPFMALNYVANAFHLFRKDHRFLIMFWYRFTTLFRARYFLYPYKNNGVPRRATRKRCRYLFRLFSILCIDRVGRLFFVLGGGTCGVKVGDDIVDILRDGPPVVTTTGRPGVTSSDGKVVPEVIIDRTVVAKQEQL